MQIGKVHRLSDVAYQSGIRPAVTACFKPSIHAFCSAELVETCVKILADESARCDCNVPVYCFMPDQHDSRDQDDAGTLKLAADRFKMTSSMGLAEVPDRTAWQKSYFVHFIRRSYDWWRQASYVCCNPIRVALVVDPFDCRFTGRFGYDPKELSEGLLY